MINQHMCRHFHIHVAEIGIFNASPLFMVNENLPLYWSSIKGIIQYVSRREVHDLTGVFRKGIWLNYPRDIVDGTCNQLGLINRCMCVAQTITFRSTSTFIFNMPCSMTISLPRNVGLYKRNHTNFAKILCSLINLVVLKSQETDNVYQDKCIINVTLTTSAYVYNNIFTTISIRILCMSSNYTFKVFGIMRWFALQNCPVIENSSDSPGAAWKGLTEHLNVAP